MKERDGTGMPVCLSAYLRKTSNKTIWPFLLAASQTDTPKYIQMDSFSCLLASHQRGKQLLLRIQYRSTLSLLCCDKAAAVGQLVRISCGFFQPLPLDCSCRTTTPQNHLIAAYL